MPHRMFRDGSDRMWEVWDVRPGIQLAIADELCDGWLAFQTRHERRRLAPVPDHWTEMTEAELRRALARAIATDKPRRLIE